MNEKLIAALDVRNMFAPCEMIIKSALYRTESRGAHYRSDYPKIASKWKKNILCQTKGKEIKLSTRKVTQVPKSIAKFFNQERKYHLLE